MRNQNIKNVKKTCSLLDMPAGAKTYVREIRKNCKMRSRLCALGFTPSAEIILLGLGENGVRVKVRDTSIVLDGDSASNIICEDCQP